MKIIGFNLFKILIERQEKIQRDLKINQNINIKEISKEKIFVSNIDAIKIKFSLIIDYSKGAAKLEFEGAVFILPEKNKSKEFLDAWKLKKIPEQYREGLFNFIMNKCNIKALNLEDELNLPAHIPLPRARIENKQKN